MKILIIMSVSYYFVSADKNNQQSRCNCGLMSSKIINGTVASIYSHPWSAALLSRQGYYGPYYLFCGGSIITPRHVLTAAHCLKWWMASRTWIAVGQHKISQINKKKMIPSQKFIIHENYNDKRLICDIGLVMTSREIKYASRVSPVCLPKTKLDLENVGTKITIAGWGKTSTTDNHSSDVLRQVEIDVVPIMQCSKSYPSLLLKNQLCTYTKGKGTFHGDSGSPGIWKNPETGEKVQVSLVSFGDWLAIKPSVETDVTAYRDWIEDKVKESTPGQSICIGQ